MTSLPRLADPGKSAVRWDVLAIVPPELVSDAAAVAHDPYAGGEDFAAELLGVYTPDLDEPFGDVEDIDAPPAEPPAPREPRLPFADWVRMKASVERVSSMGDPDADRAASAWLAAKIDELSALAFRYSANSPAEFDARHELEEYSRDARVEARGYDAAMADCQR